MTRDELLDKLAMELPDWPLDSGQARWSMPGVEWATMGASVFAEAFNGRDISEKEWLQRRSELINRPSWDDAPEWAEWLAQDEDGAWTWFRNKPAMHSHEWGMHERNVDLKASQDGKLPAGHDWRQTLEKRPLDSHIEDADSSVSHRMASEEGAPRMDCGTTDSIHGSNCPSHERDQGEQRIDNIGRNGEAETRHDCSRCGGSYYTPPHDECPCADGATTKSETGLKFDTDKPRMELLIQGMPRALEAVGQVLTFGAKKYAAHNWKLVDGAEDRYWAAKCRHELSRARGEDKDPETGLLHLAHEATNALFLLELALANQAEDKP